MKRLRGWIKNCIFHDRFSFNLPQNDPEVNIIVFKGQGQGSISQTVTDIINYRVSHSVTNKWS